MSAPARQVVVTHFINPNRFFICDLSRKSELDELRVIETKLQCLLNNTQQNNNQRYIKKSDLVCYFSPISKKWIRCAVENFTKQGKDDVAILWALDYGLPLSTKLIGQLVPLPKEFQSHIKRSPMMSCGLQIMPTIFTVDKKTNAKKLVIMDGWEDEVVELCQKWISDAESLHFDPLDHCATDDIQFGRLIIKTVHGTEFDMSQVLTREFRAATVSPEKFTSLFNRSYSAVIDRWNDNYNCGDVHVPDATVIPQIGEPPERETTQMRLERQNIKDDIDKENATEALRRSIMKVEEWRMTLENNVLEEIPYDSPEDLTHERKRPHRKPKIVSTPLKCLTFSSSEPEPQLLPVPSIDSEQASLQEQTSRPRKMIKISKIIKEHLTTRSKNLASGATVNQDIDPDVTKIHPELPDQMEVNSKLTSGSSLNQMKTIPSIPTEAPLINSEASSSELKDTEVQADKLVLTSAQLAQGGTRNSGNDENESKVNDSPCSQPNAFMMAIMNKLQTNASQRNKPARNKTYNIEKWTELEVGAEYSISICNFESCRSFYIQVHSEPDRWDELMDMLNRVKDLNLMKELVVGKMCLVEWQNELHRAKIIRCSETSVMCFCVDTSELVYFQNERELIYDIPENILNFMPCQVVNCRLAGIKSPSSFKWSFILYNRVASKLLQPKIKVLNKINNPEIATLGIKNINSYEVSVFEKGIHGEEISLVARLMQFQLAEVDELA